MLGSSYVDNSTVQIHKWIPPYTPFVLNTGISTNARVFENMCTVYLKTNRFFKKLDRNIPPYLPDIKTAL